MAIGKQLQLAGAARIRRRDMEFLPGALEIIETPPSPINMVLISTICLFAVIALAWAYLGRIDIIATAQGKIQPVGRTKVVQPLDTGKVLNIKAINGQKVRAGDVLVELDARESLADEMALSTQLWTAEAETARRAAALEAALRKSLQPVPAIDFPFGLPDGIERREQAVLSSDLGALRAETAGLELQVREKNAEAAGYTSTIAAEETLVATLRERVDMRATLVKLHSTSKANLIDAQESLETQLTYLSNLNAQLTQARASADTASNAIATAFDKFIAENAQKRADAERLRDEAADKLAKAKVSTSHMELRSPIDGIVQGSVVTSPGQVVTVGEELMQIVPERGEIEIESYLPNQDIGFVKPGDTARVKIEAFPFTRYGTVDATVTRVAHDAIPSVEADQREGDGQAATRSVNFGGAQRTQNLVFPLSLSLAQKTIDVDGATVSLSPGMAVTVEIKTGRRRILEYLFSPLVEIASQAIHER
jgi:hemolysin D